MALVDIGVFSERKKCRSLVKNLPCRNERITALTAYFSLNKLIINILKRISYIKFLISNSLVWFLGTD